ncbi:MAG: hypothetical protein H6577_21675 [Lewinellaceae bacterium]|nr:hypothetical protein [Saprospiraceae bacterium]MCB9340743.1 hypothetical protein [Lewinellaceae bacterium]
MKQTSILTILFSVLTMLLFGQAETPPGTLNWGDEYNEPNGTAATKLIGIVPEGFYVLRQKVLQNPSAKPRAWVEFFTKDMKLKRSEEMELKYKGKQRDFEDVILLNKKLYLLTSFNNTAKKRNYLFKQELSEKTLMPSKNLEMICETEAKNKEVEGTFAFHISKDSSKLLVYNSLPNENKNPERFGFRVFNENFDLIWEKNIVLPYPDNKFTVEDYQVDNQGNVYLLGVLYQDEAKWRRRGNPTYNYVVLSYTNEGNDAKEYRIDLADKFITDLTFRVANGGTLICCGFYSERGTYSIKGAYYFRLDPKTGEMTNRNSQPFDFEFLTEFMSEKNKQKAKEAKERNDVRRGAELYNYSLDELILRSDGGAVLVAEQFYIEQETYRDNPFGYYPYGFYSPYSYRSNIQTDYYYHYNDIIVVNIRPTGEIEWASRIPKQQETKNDGGYYSSYAMSIVRDKLYFLFNDNARNYSPDRKENRFYNYNGSESIIVLAQLNTKGELKTFPLASNKDAGVITRPKMCKQIGKREMAIFGERGRGFRFANLTFE